MCDSQRSVTAHFTLLLSLGSRALRLSRPRQSRPSSRVFNELSIFIFHFRWLSYIPKRKGASLPITPQFLDPIDRPVEYCPRENQVYDPRWLFEGQIDEKDDYLSGFFDRGSFDEIMAGWAKTVVTGRARLGNIFFLSFFQFFRKFKINKNLILGGIPVAVIGVETRTVEVTLPADPANPDSESKLISQVCTLGLAKQDLWGLGAKS